MNNLKIFTFTLLSLCTLMLTAKDYKASVFGVKSDGITLNSRSIQKGVDFISENGGGRLVFYVGRYLTGSIQLKSNVTIQLEEGAVLVGVASVYDYSGINGTKALIRADSLENIGIGGKGVIEGQGASLLEQINVQDKKGYLKESVAQARPMLISINNCSNINIEQVNLMNACGDVQSYAKCKNLSVSGVTVKSTVVKGSKGIIFAGCDGVRLTNSYFETSGVELSSAGSSKNVSVIDCKSSTGKKLQAKN